MLILSPAREAVPRIEGLELVHRGKVRDTYRLPDDKLLVIATDAVSIFDFVLNVLVPMKGIVLNALNHFWSTFLGAFDIPTHLLATGVGARTFLPPLAKERWDAQMTARMAVVNRLDMIPVEFIARGILTGSGFKSYAETGTVCGHRLQRDIGEGDELPFVMDTPTTKAQEGHDEPMDAAEVRDKYPAATHRTLQIYQIIANFARTRGIRLVDTKFEFGFAPRTTDLILGDEIGTPDSSRYWDERAWQKSRAASSSVLPPSLDKQFVRNWGKTAGIDKLRHPEDPAECAQVHALEVPEHVIRATTQIYRYLFWRLTGDRIETYATGAMSSPLPSPKRTVAIVVGSESDLPAVRQGLRAKRGVSSLNDNFTVNVVSCHRNLDALLTFARRCDGVDAVVAAGGKAFALAGVLDALLHINGSGKNIPVVGVALGKSGSEELLAAQLSISQLPGTPVVMDELTGTVYSGPEGIENALTRIFAGELPPPKPRTEKPARFDIPWNELFPEPPQ